MAQLVSSKEFIVTALTLFALVVASFMPDFHFDVEHAASLALVFIPYLAGIAVDPGPGGWRSVILSRKFWSAFIGFVLVMLDAFRVVLPDGLTPELLISMAAMLGGLIANFALQGTPGAQIARKVAAQNAMKLEE